MLHAGAEGTRRWARWCFNEYNIFVGGSGYQTAEANLDSTFRRLFIIPETESQ